MPILSKNGISNGYMKLHEGLVQSGTGPGVSRGALRWNDVCYRVMGDNLTRVNSDGSVTTLGTFSMAKLPTSPNVSMNHSFDRLSISVDGNLYYWDGTTLTQVTDPDLGVVLDHTWIDGYFMTTDGENLVVTDLSDPLSVNPIRYGSSELDPDPILAVINLEREIHALNRFTIEVFDNIGGSGFPFQVIDGAQISKGVVGTHMCADLDNNLAFVGGGKNESISVWLSKNGNVVRIATREIELILSEYTEQVLSKCKVEVRLSKSQNLLYVHLPDKTLVYDAVMSQAAQDSIWFVLSSSTNETNLDAQYKGRDFVWCYDKWLVGDPTSGKVGYLSESDHTHWGVDVKWLIGTYAVYNDGSNGVIHELELVSLTGRHTSVTTSTIWTRYSNNGVDWSRRKPILTGAKNNRNKRLVWLSQGPINQWRVQEFLGNVTCNLSFLRLNMNIEPLGN